MSNKTKNKKTELMRKIRDEVISDKSLPLYEYRIQNKYLPVIGEGSNDAKIMFIGEGPGKNEAKTGRPFCGAAGRVLDELLQSVGIKREDVYIGNILKDRPPQNRDPLPKEIDAYGPYLDRQIEIIRPKIIATLGRFSMKYIMEKFGLEGKLETISNAHGKLFEAKTSYGKINIIPFYHPAFAVYDASKKDMLKEDFKQLSKVASQLNS